MVRNVFKIRSLRLGYSHARSNVLEKRWNTVKSYLCGDDEWNSVAADKDSASVSGSSKGVFSSDMAVVQDSGNSSRSSRPATARISCEEQLLNSNGFAEEDFDSIKSSEATVTQPIVDYNDTSDKTEEEEEEEVRIEKPNSTLKLFQQEDAAIIIQSAFRHYLARRKHNELKMDDHGKFPSPESFGSSLKVQIGDSTETSSFDVEIDKNNVCKPIQKRFRTQQQVLKIQEDWDDSTVSSTISRKRIQNRIEAATRRERALAYAFAQQMRMCSKQRRTKCNSLDGNSSLSWLERWMATRSGGPGSIFMENQRRRTKRSERKMMDSVKDPKESCGSNEVSVKTTYNYKNKALTTTSTKRNISRRRKTLHQTTHSGKKG